MDTKTLTLVVDGNKRDTFEVETFEVSYGLYEESDIVIIINTKQENLVAEGVLRPSKQGIYKDKLVDVELKDTLYMHTYDELREKFFPKILRGDVSKDYLFVEKLSLSTKAYYEGNAIQAIQELVMSESALISDGFIRTVKGPKMEFVVEDYLKITEDVEIYKKRIDIEDAKVKDTDNG
jgi:hypothetical protein